MRKGDIVTILERSANVDDWYVLTMVPPNFLIIRCRWKGKIDSRTGNFPANFVEVVNA